MVRYIFNPRRSFRARLVLVVGILGLITAVLLSYWLGFFAGEQIKKDKGALLAELAAQMAREMDKGIFERRREIQIVASLQVLRDGKVPLSEKRDLLETLKSSYPNYAWLGIADTEGNIIVGSQSLLEGKSVKTRNWFTQGASETSVGNVHDAFLLAKLQPKPAHDFLPLRLLDISTPIKDGDGRLLGVLCGHLSWDWAFEVRNSLLEPLKHEHHLEVVIVNADGNILLSTPELSQLTEKLDLSSLQQVRERQQGYLVETWPDGQPYLTGFYASHGYADYPGLGWTMLVRQNIDQAYAPVYQLQHYTFLIVASFCLLFIVLLWLVIGRLVRPMHDIAESADKIRFGEAGSVEIPVIKGHDEVAVMSQSLRDLLTTLDAKNRELKLSAQVFQSSTEGIVITDANQRILTINRAYSGITGYSEQEVVGRKPSILSSGLHPPEFYQTMWQQIGLTSHWQGEVVNRRKDGILYPEWLNISTVYDENHAVAYYVGIFSDITERKSAEEKIRYLANHDVLTSLPNRVVFEERVSAALHHAKQQQTHIAVLFVDLDRFKNINDSLGHPMGDRVLQELARRMQGCVAENDTLARFGGDEFVVVMRDLAHPGVAAQLAQALIKQITPAIHIDGYNLHVSASIGISLYPQDGDNAMTLVRNADAAMFHAKGFESSSFRFFTAELNQRVSERLRVENALHQALAKQQLFLVYQPQFELQTRRLTGAEVLLRWQHPELGMVSPASFIPIAEETGLIVAIGEWVIQQALSEYAKLTHMAEQPFCLAINISPVQIEHSDIVAIIDKALRDNDLQTDSRLQLEVEITESAIVRSLDAANNLINLLHERGIEVAIDDFGTGYSNLGILRKLEIDRLKIDQSFVSQLPDNANNTKLVKTIIGMALSLDLKIIAEGVENMEQVQCLQSLGCHDGQGYLLAKPMLIDELYELIGKTTD
ncbi:MAG: EAL domain-containing protein [Methylococcaceae bacterium]|nr:EAL domain-containing protein [Methylococcaceae bacterium]